jgi:hypothetical protein
MFEVCINDAPPVMMQGEAGTELGIGFAPALPIKRDNDHEETATASQP